MFNKILLIKPAAFLDGLLEKLPAQKVNATKYTNTTIMTERSAVVKPSRQLLTIATSVGHNRNNAEAFYFPGCKHAF